MEAQIRDGHWELVEHLLSKTFYSALSIQQVYCLFIQQIIHLY